jgi:GDPmannose 4,6-dehydratase
MWKILQQDHPDDYVIATGESNTLELFVETAFSLLGLDWRSHVVIDESQYRPSDIVYSAGNPEKALKKLDWSAKVKLREVVSKMISSERQES